MTSMLDQLLNALPILGGIVFLTFLMYVFYTNEKARKISGSIFPLLPFLLEFLASKIPDKKGVFDAHDASVLIARGVRRLNSIVSDPSNAEFSDVEEDIRNFVSEELVKYQQAGLKGVPDLSSKQVSQLIHLIFSTFKSLEGHIEDVGSDQ